MRIFLILDMIPVKFCTNQDKDAVNHYSIVILPGAVMKYGTVIQLEI
jgi:hypothetical protein